MLVVTNRFTIHVAVAVIAAVVAVLNIQTTEVRAETFGERSLMYQLVTRQDFELIEEGAVDVQALEVSNISYRDKTALTSYTRGIDFVYSEDSAIALVSGSSIAAPTISESAESTAPRTAIETYTVQDGDTLSTIAEKFDISLNTLLWANNLTVRSVLKPGATLEILPTSGVSHTVSSGDTLTKIADKYEVEEDEILEFNRLASADDLVTGETLIVPGGVIQAPTPSTSSAITRIFTTTPSTSSVPTTTSTIEPTVTGTGAMVWPTDLRTITQYYGWSHTGLDIDCGFTHDNYAADAGIVQFTGWKGGYGYTVEINHGNGLVTRYGHHASMYVTAGQQVYAGQPIGRCGTTGRSTGTHLHFEVMANGRFRNPLEYIR